MRRFYSRQAKCSFSSWSPKQRVQYFLTGQAHNWAANATSASRFTAQRSTAYCAGSTTVCLAASRCSSTAPTQQIQCPSPGPRSSPSTGADKQAQPWPSSVAQAQSSTGPDQLGDRVRPRSGTASQQHQQVRNPSIPPPAAWHDPPDPLGPRSVGQNPQNGPCGCLRGTGTFPCMGGGNL
ncbi:hypothetical protein NDU88_007605 [Pleurodeles waltl]|uniref:Uncharacterized protein n=1 Tax=Pleurodeles waltl TaxID=8319 RepID=A0AAV7N2J5_PLEWA|nr:hypothetical protein NDU88_007605 [Pleurodeles waltl]